jgi:DNA recombination protein RmuC
MELLLAGLALLLVAALGVASLALLRLSQRPPAPAPTGIEALTALLMNLDAETRRMAERVATLEGVPQAVANLNIATHGVSQHLSALQTVPQAVAALDEKTRGVADRLTTLDAVRTSLDDLRATARERHVFEQQTAESVRRLEMVIAGTQSKGAAGEGILEAVFASLPIEWQVRNFRVDNRTAEFGLRLPNGLVLPVDSKWAGTDLITQLAASEDPVERARLKGALEGTVRERAREVAKYVHPELTPGFGLAVVPDAAYELCSAVNSETYRDHKVIVVSYSLFVPYILIVYQSTLRGGRNIDLAKMEAALDAVEQTVGQFQAELDGRLARTARMLSNSRHHLGTLVSRIQSGVTSLRSGEVDRPALLDEGDGEAQPLLAAGAVEQEREEAAPREW